MRKHLHPCPSLSEANYNAMSHFILTNGFSEITLLLIEEKLFSMKPICYFCVLLVWDYLS